MEDIFDSLKRKFFIIVDLDCVDTDDPISFATTVKTFFDNYDVSIIFRLTIKTQNKKRCDITKKIRATLNVPVIMYIYKSKHIKYISDSIDIIHVSRDIIEHFDTLRDIIGKNKIMYISRTGYYSSNILFNDVKLITSLGNNKIIIEDIWYEDNKINMDTSFISNAEDMNCLLCVNNYYFSSSNEKYPAITGKLAVSMEANGLCLNLCSRSIDLVLGGKLNKLLNFIGINKKIYNINYTSSSQLFGNKPIKGVLGTIESDASGIYGDYCPEKIRGSKILYRFLNFEFNTVLDVGAGCLGHAKVFIEHGKIVDVVDFGNSVYFLNRCNDVNIRKLYIGDFNNILFSDKYDAIWCSHILEHQLNVNAFLKKINNLLYEGGYLSIIVPIRKPFIVGGHVTMWNAGLLLYNLILAGFDCKECHILQYDYNIGIIVQKKEIKDMPVLSMDKGDIELLSKYFPFNVSHNFNGDILEYNF